MVDDITLKKLDKLLDDIREEAIHILEGGDHSYVDVEHLIADLALTAHEFSMYEHYNSIYKKSDSNVIELKKKEK